MSDLASTLTEEQLNILKDAALDFALSHGLVVRPPPAPESKDDPHHATLSTGVINAPISLFPTPFPKQAYKDAVQVQPLFNQLVHEISEDDAFLKEIMERYGKDKGNNYLHEIAVMDFLLSTVSSIAQI